MKTLNERNAVLALMGLLDQVMAAGTATANRACVSWLSGVPRSASANEPTYDPIVFNARRYRTSAKKSAIVRTIHSILSKTCQNVLSKLTGAGAAWLLGL